MSDPSKPPADAPLISITLQPITLRLGAALITAALLLVVGGLGIASSPIVNGHPVLLSPERLALKTYLDTATVWQQRFTVIDRQLALIETPQSVSSATAPTATVITASPIVTGTPLRLVADLAALDADQQQIAVPPALNALHTLARSTLQAFANWSTAALEVIGAPTPDNVMALQSRREAAHIALDQFRQALETQRQEAP